MVCLLLQKLAMELLLQVSSPLCCERNYSIYSFINSMKRSKMTPRRAEDLYIYTLIFVFYRGEKVHDTPKERQMCGMRRRSFDLFWEVGKLKVATTYLTKRL